MNFYKDTAPTVVTNNGDKVGMNDIAVNSKVIPNLVDTGVKNLAPKNSGATSGSGYFFQNQKSIMIPSGTEIVISFDYQTSDNQISVQLTNSADSVIMNTIVYTSSSSKSGHIEKHLTLTLDAYGYNAYYSGSGTASISNFMICTKDMWNVSNTYEPHALPVTTITPELIELVDSGAKNKCPTNSISGIGASQQISMIIPAGTWIIYIGSLSSTDTDASTCQVGLFNGSTNVGSTGSTTLVSRGTNIVAEITTTGTANRLIIYSSDTDAHGTGDTLTATNIMVCSKAAWLVTQTYVPYRPSLETLYSRYPVTVQNNASFTAANTWTYTGVTAHIPAGKICLVVASMNYNVGKPLGICICNNIDPTKAGAVASTLAYFETAEEDMKMMVPTCMFVNPNASGGATTLYVHAKNSSTVGVSSVRLSMIYLN